MNYDTLGNFFNIKENTSISKIFDTLLVYVQVLYCKYTTYIVYIVLLVNFRLMYCTLQCT